MQIASRAPRVHAFLPGKKVKKLYKRTCRLWKHAIHWPKHPKIEIFWKKSQSSEFYKVGKTCKQNPGKSLGKITKSHKKMRKNATNCKKKNVFVFSPPFQGIGNGRLIESLVIVHHSSTLTNLEIIIWHQQEVQEVLLFMNQCRWNHSILI